MVIVIMIMLIMIMIMIEIMIILMIIRNINVLQPLLILVMYFRSEIYYSDFIDIKLFHKSNLKS